MPLGLFIDLGQMHLASAFASKPDAGHRTCKAGTICYSNPFHSSLTHIYFRFWIPVLADFRSPDVVVVEIWPSESNPPHWHLLTAHTVPVESSGMPDEGTAMQRQPSTEWKMLSTPAVSTPGGGGAFWPAALTVSFTDGQ